MGARVSVESAATTRVSTRARRRSAITARFGLGGVFLEVPYNRQRRHSTLGHISPEAFEARMSA